MPAEKLSNEQVTQLNLDLAALLSHYSGDELRDFYKATQGRESIEKTNWQLMGVGFDETVTPAVRVEYMGWHVALTESVTKSRIQQDVDSSPVKPQSTFWKKPVKKDDGTSCCTSVWRSMLGIRQ